MCSNVVRAALCEHFIGVGLGVSVVLDYIVYGDVLLFVYNSTLLYAVGFDLVVSLLYV